MFFLSVLKPPRDSFESELSINQNKESKVESKNPKEIWKENITFFLHGDMHLMYPMIFFTGLFLSSQIAVIPDMIQKKFIERFPEKPFYEMSHLIMITMIFFGLGDSISFLISIYIIGIYFE